MNKTRPTIKVVCVMLAFVVIVASAVSLVACNKEVSVADIFRHTTSPDEFTDVTQECVLPSGWAVYTSSATSSSSSVSVNSDVGYIKSIEALVISTTDSAGDTCLSLVRLNDDNVYYEGGMAGMMFPLYLGISALRVKDGLIALKHKNGEVSVINLKGQTVLSRSKTQNVSGTIDVAIKILDSELIAINYAYDKTGYNGYTSIYRPTTSGDASNRGELICRVQNQDNDLSYVSGFDSKYVTVVGNEEGSYIFTIPTSTSTVKNVKAEEDKGLIADNGEEDYSSEITYMGDGKFYIHQEWIVDSGEDYTYYDGESYCAVSRHVYTPDKEKMTEYADNSGKIFKNITNNYYDSTKASVDTREYLNDGFTYVSYGIDVNVENGVKVGYYDQFVLDSDFNIVLSLTGNYGIQITMQDSEDVGVFDLIMSYIDDVMYVPYLPSSANYYDANGTLIGSNSDYTIVAQNYANGIAVAQASFTSGSTTTTAFGAFNKKGEVVVPFKYTSLTAFRGYYALGERDNEDGDNTPYLIGRDGKEIEYMSDMSTPLADIATNNNGNYSYEIGCYLYREQIDDVWYLGIKNFNANADKNVIMKARMTECILYAPSSSTVDVFVFEKITASDSSVSYVVYRLI